MDLRFTQEEVAFRNEVRTFFESALPESIRRKDLLGQRTSREDIVTWQRILNKKGWATPMWPKEYGGTGWDAVRYFIYKEEMNRANAPEPLGMNVHMVGPVIIAFGTPEQKQEFLPKVQNLDLWFCQGFSEPGSGSDLASLKSRAVRDGDHYVINGQKLWTTNGHRADWMFGLFRTDTSAKKQMGISYILLDMKTPGITLRPIITIDGNHNVNEVFFDNVRVPVKNLIGEENKGWTYAKFLLGNERVGIARVGGTKSRVAYAKMVAAQTMVGDQPLSDDPRFREKMALIEVELKALEMTNIMVVADMKKQGVKATDPRTSVLKIKGSELQQSITELLVEIAGPNAMVRQVDYLCGDTDETLVPEWHATAAANYFFTRTTSIYGGTNEIQHNVVAKGVLGL
jgi:alkylation response protein AidB-like acyl-CoA dehydrogenase